jgi:hypothetical protein
VVLCVLIPRELVAREAPAMTQDARLRQQVKELQAAASEVEVRLVSGTKVRGHIMWADATSFSLRTKNGKEWTWPYSEVADVKRRGPSWPAKLAIIGGGALAVLCFAPFPIGLLCQKDPS